jgi:hypothetical protein
LDPANKNNPEARARGYIYAFLAFLSLVGKSEADVIHLWFGRRACTRIRSELMASIYAKALVRKDFSGIIEKKDEEQKDPKANDKGSGAQSSTSENSKDKEAKDNTKNTSGADVGKIVNLMSSDAGSVSQTASVLYLLYVSLLHCVLHQVRS